MKNNYLDQYDAALDAWVCVAQFGRNPNSTDFLLAKYHSARYAWVMATLRVWDASIAANLDPQLAEYLADYTPDFIPSISSKEERRWCAVVRGFNESRDRELAQRLDMLDRTS